MRPGFSALTIRPAAPDDAPRVAEIHVRAWQVAYADIVPPEHLASLSVEKRAAMWREAIEKRSPELWVARTGEAGSGHVVGWVSFGPSRDEGAAIGTGEVWALYVDPPHWTAGVGQHLWRCARDRLLAGGFTNVTLWVLAANVRAIRFYEAAGFAIETESRKTFELGGRPIEELRCRIAL